MTAHYFLSGSRRRLREKEVGRRGGGAEAGLGGGGESRAGFAATKKAEYVWEGAAVSGDMHALKI